MSDRPMLTSEEFISALRALMAQVPAPPPLSKAERRMAHNNARMSDDELQASVGIVWASEEVVSALGIAADDLKQIIADTHDWRPAQNELQGALRLVTDANITRRARASIIARQAYGIGSQLARNPEHAGLAVHVAAVRRIKALKRRRGKSSATPDGAEETGPEP